MQARLAANDLACRRGDRVLFRGLSLALGPGDVLHVTGANGIGKSSLLRLLAGLATPFAGTVERTGSIGLLDERLALDPDWPLARALAFWERLDGAQDAGAIHHRLGLDDLLDVPVRYLSTGQRKRAAMARLISQDAAIWLLDEPLSGLDDASQQLVGGIVSEHAERGGIVVLASHQELAAERRTYFALAEFVA